MAIHGEEPTSRRKADNDVKEGAVPAYVLDCDNTSRAKVTNDTENDNDGCINAALLV